jgi:hypothetical protein
MGTPKTDLGFLSGVVRRGFRGGWTVPKAQKLLVYLREISITKEPFNVDRAVATTGMSVGGCKAMVKELLQSSENGMTLEDYFEQDRPFKIRPKALA